MARDKLPSSPCKWTWNNSTARIYEVLGIKGTKIPAKMHGRFTIDGWKIVVKRSPTATKPYDPIQRASRNEWGYRRHRAKTAKHRVFVEFNGELVPAGRVSQALCRRELHHVRKNVAARRGPKGQFTERKRR